MIPTIETERLILRKAHAGDVDAVCALWADPAVTRYISGNPLARRQAWMGMLHILGHWELYGYGGWHVEEKSSGAFVGQVGFQQFVRDIDANIDAPHTVAIVHPQNAASLRVANGRGYREIDRTMYATNPVVLFERVRYGSME